MIRTGKTYKIVSIHTDKIYVGSTTRKLSYRLSGHVSNYKQFLLGKYHNVQSFDIIKLGDYQIELLEDHGQITKLELLKFEKAAMLLYSDMIVNKCIPSGLGSRKEYMGEYNADYRAKNKEKIKEYKGEYHAKNKEHILEQMKEYRAKNKEKIQEKFTCDVCSGKYTHEHKARHLKSQKHIHAI